MWNVNYITGSYSPFSTRVNDTNNIEGVEGTCPSAHPILRTYVPVRTLSLPSALLDQTRMRSPSAI